MSKLDKRKIWTALSRLGELSVARSLELELCIYGGSAMMLAFDRQAVTKDVDAVFHPRESAKPLIEQVAEEQGLTSDWLNDDVLRDDVRALITRIIAEVEVARTP